MKASMDEARPSVREARSRPRMTVLKPYRAYRESGVEWLGEVPEHWEVRRMATVAGLRVSNVDKHVREGESPVRLCNYLDVYHNERIGADVPFMAGTAKEREIRKFRLAVGDVLITKDSEDWSDIGVPALVEYAADDLVCGYHLAMLRPNGACLDGGYLFQALQDSHVAWQWQVAAAGVTRYGLSQNAIRSMRIPLPPLTEQTAIASYLDAAGRCIRRYIRAKEQLIELLGEERQATIHEAVTGGIDVRTGQPYPSYRDSGVEQLGKVPEHWEVRRMATSADLRVSNVDKHVREGESPVRLCNYLDVYHSERIGADVPFMAGTAKEREIRKFRLAVGDVLITKDSEDWSDIGVPALVEYAADDLVCGYHLAMLRPNGACLDGGYLFQALQDSHVAWQWQVASAGVTRYGLSQNAIRSMRIPLPPLPEQTAIARYLDDATATIDRTIELTRSQIALAEEYRTRLISDVVTGKLDVREAAAELPKADPDGNGSRGARTQAQANSRTARSGIAAAEAGP